jgi:hypothetical protein
MEPTALEQLRKGVYEVDARIDDMNVNGIAAIVELRELRGLRRRRFSTRSTRQGQGARASARLQRLAHRRVVRRAPRPLHPVRAAAHLGSEGHGGGSQAHRGERLHRGLASTRIPPCRSCRASTTLTGSRCGRPWPSTTSRSVCTSAPATPRRTRRWKRRSRLGSAPCPCRFPRGAADWLHLEALERYPGMKIALSEGGIGWIPYFLERSGLQP